MSNPTSSIPELYKQFNLNFAAAKMDEPSQLGKYLDVLCNLQTAITTEAEKTNPLSEKIQKMKDELLKELSAKISMLVEKDFKHKPSASSTTQPVLDCVGIGNKDNGRQLANCWANSLIQMSVHNPYHARVFRVVGEHYLKDLNLQLKQAGKYLLDAVNLYQTRIAEAQSHQRTPAAIPSSISQNVRLAFYILFGLNQNPRSQQDAHEALQLLRTRYEEIERTAGTFPCAGYSAMETRGTYRPKPGVGPELRTVHRDTYTGPRLKQGHEYQLALDAAEIPHGLPLETLLGNYFLQTEGPEMYFMAADGIQQQLYECTKKENYFTGDAPQTLTVVLKRNKYNVMTGQAEKADTRVTAGRIIALPAHAMQANTRDHAYALLSFILHTGGSGGGHYITYKNTPQGWVECNDDIIRRMSNADIDAILRGSEPYVLDYRLVPTAQQENMLRQRADELRALKPTATKPSSTSSSKEIALRIKVVQQLQMLQQRLQMKGAHDNELSMALVLLNHLSPIHFQTLCKLTAFHQGSSEKEGESILFKNPKILSSIKTNWIWSSSEDIIGQCIRMEMEKIEILKYEEALSKLKPSEISEKMKKGHVLLRYKYSFENLKTLYALLRKDPPVKNEHILAMCNHFPPLPEEWTKQMYKRIEQFTGKPDGKAQFAANPRLLLAPILKGNPSSKSILEEILIALK